MNQSQATTLILQRWIDTWPGLSSSTPYTFDNEADDESPAYARVSVQSLSSQEWTLGENRKVRRNGNVVVKLYYPTNTGRVKDVTGGSPIDQAVQWSRSTYELRRLASSPGDDLVITAGTAREIGVEGKFFVTSVTFPYYFVELVAAS